MSPWVTLLNQIILNCKYFYPLQQLTWTIHFCDWCCQKTSFLFILCVELLRRRQWHPTPVLLPGKSHGQRSMVGCSPWGPEGWTWLSDFTFTFHFHALEKEMATHSSVLAWRVPGTGEPGELLSVGLHRGGHDWSDLAAAAAEEPWKCDSLEMCPRLVTLSPHLQEWKKYSQPGFED